MSTRGEVIIDDGTFYIELNVNYPPASAPGFLHVRRPTSDSSGLGDECIGAFQEQLNGKWSADVQAPPGDDSDWESDIRSIVTDVDRMTAIVSLWRARKMAWIRA